MSAIKYTGRHLWRVTITYDYLSGRPSRELWITTNAKTGAHIKAAERKTEEFLFQNENYPNSRVESINRAGVINA